ncbi:MAG: ECF transporter S component [Clostridia bacterium]|nr:ECF transporter S component [Clostridia bacterium]
MKLKTRNIVLSGACLALCLLLPFLTGQIPEVGKALSPMHIPVLLCGFICGWPYALVVGLIAPILRFFLFQMPPIMPTGTAMAFELATYGAVSGLLYQKLPKKNYNIYVSLIGAMIAGRLVWGCAQLLLVGVTKTPFTWQAFAAGAFISVIPGIICHIVLIPVIVLTLKKAGFLENGIISKNCQKASA